MVYGLGSFESWNEWSPVWASITQVAYWADVVSYPRHTEVTPSPWHTGLPQANRKLPQGPNPIGTLVPRHRWFGKQSNKNVSVPLRNTYLIPSPSVIKPCWRLAAAIGTHALTAKQLLSIQMRKEANSAAHAPFSCHDSGHGFVWFRSIICFPMAHLVRNKSCKASLTRAPAWSYAIY